MRRQITVSSARARMALWAIFMVAGAIAAAVAFLLLLGRGADKKRCTEPVAAVVVDYETVVSKSKEFRSTYAPVFEYEYRGQTYRHKSSISTNPPRFQIGQRVELMIDPNNPATAYDKSGAADAACVIVIAASGIFLFLGIFGVSLNSKRIKQIKENPFPPSYPDKN